MQCASDTHGRQTDKQTEGTTCIYFQSTTRVLLMGLIWDGKLTCGISYKCRVDDLGKTQIVIEGNMERHQQQHLRRHWFPFLTPNTHHNLENGHMRALKGSEKHGDLVCNAVVWILSTICQAQAPTEGALCATFATSTSSCSLCSAPHAS